MEGSSSPLPSADDVCGWSDFAAGELTICTPSLDNHGGLAAFSQLSLHAALEFFVKLLFQLLYSVYLSIGFLSGFDLLLS